MNKIDIQKNLNEGMDIEGVIKKFIKQVFNSNENLTIDEQTRLDRNLARVDIRCRSIDPRVNVFTVYMVCAQSQIDKLLDFDKEYVHYRKNVREFPSNIGKIKSLIYNIEYDENDSWFYTIQFRVIKAFSEAHLIKDILIAEDDLVYANDRLNYLNVIF